jgi:hypothetical protein
MRKPKIGNVPLLWERNTDLNHGLEDGQKRDLDMGRTRKLESLK